MNERTDRTVWGVDGFACEYSCARLVAREAMFAWMRAGENTMVAGWGTSHATHYTVEPTEESGRGLT